MADSRTPPGEAPAPKTRQFFRRRLLEILLVGGFALVVFGLPIISERQDWWTTSIRELYYSGSRFECNICGRTLTAFERSPFTQGEKQCPFCFSRPRHRTMYRWFQERSDLYDGRSKRMLHVAPEVALSPKFQAIPNLDYLSGDLDPRLAMVQMDITDIRYPDNSFDVIYCSHVLEHVPDDRKAMRELARVLKPGGWAVIAVPIWHPTATYEDPSVTSKWARWWTFGQSDHVRMYGPDFLDRLQTEGFAVEIDRVPSTFTDKDVERYGLSREDVYISRKGAPEPN